MSVRWVLVLAPLLPVALGNAQDESRRMECDDQGWGWRTPGGHVCELRALSVPATGALAVDADHNGSIRVSGDSRRDVQVRAKVQAWGDDEAEAERIARAVTIRSDGVLRADGPERGGGRGGWSVSYEVLAPHDMDLDLTTYNGGIAVVDVRGELALQAHNGGITVDGVAGNVRGRTTNGGVDATLTGNTWDGAGLDLTTTNGGVRLRVPENYSARLETRTVNGGVDIDFPVVVQGRVGREISTVLGDGGALLRAATTNGQVRVSRR